MKLDEFKNSKAGAVVARLLKDGAVLSEMLREPRRRPPVQALQRGLHAAGIQLSDRERQHVGRWTAEFLSRHGLKPIPGRHGAKRAPLTEPGPLTSGALYAPVKEPTAAERIAKARAILEPYDLPPGQVDAFLRERREEWGERND